MQESTGRKLLIDENLSRRLISVIEKNFPASIHVATANLLESDDRAVWEFAKENGYCVLTKDWDYRFLSVALGCPPKVIRLACGNKTTTFISGLLRQRTEVINEFLEDAETCYLEIE